MSEEFTRDGIVLASTIDTWRSLDESPKKNGWYDVKIWGVYKKSMAEILALGLWRDGEWVDTAGRKILGWSEPMRFRDTGSETVDSNEGAVRLAQCVLQKVYHEEFVDAFEDLLTAKTNYGYDGKIERYLSINRFMDSDVVQICSLGLVKQSDIVKTLCGKVLRKHKVRRENVDETRQSIHAAIKAYKKKCQVAAYEEVETKAQAMRDAAAKHARMLILYAFHHGQERWNKK